MGRQAPRSVEDPRAYLGKLLHQASEQPPSSPLRVRLHEVIFEADPEGNSGIAPDFSLADWRVTSEYFSTQPYQPFADQAGDPMFALVFIATRDIRYYLLKVFLPLLLIVAMSWTVFWIDPDDMGMQMSVSVSSML